MPPEEMAMSWCVVRRAASMATRSARAPLAPASSYSRLCFSTDESPNSEPTASHKDRWSSHRVGSGEDRSFYRKTGDKIPQEIASYSNVEGLPFDSIKVDHSRGTMTLRRKTKDENLVILVRERYDHIEKCKCVCMCVKFLYGDDLKKCMKFDIISLPDDQVFIRRVKLRAYGDKYDKVHLDKMEGFVEKRGINLSNLEFMIKYAEKRRAHLNKYGRYGKN